MWFRALSIAFSAILFFLAADAFSEPQRRLPPMYFLNADKYEQSVAGALSAIQDGIRDSDRELIMNGLRTLFFNEYEVATGKRLGTLYRTWKEKCQTHDSLTWGVEVLFIATVVQYDDVDRKEWCEYLSTVKENAIVSTTEGISFPIRATFELARTTIPLDVFPAYVVGYIRRHANVIEYRDSGMCEALFGVYKDRVTKEMLVAFARTHSGRASVREAIDRLGKEKFGVNCDELAALPVDLAEIEKSVGIAGWPENVMPEKVNYRRPRASLSPEQKYSWDQGFSLDKSGYIHLLRDGIANSDEGKMLNAFRCLREFETLDCTLFGEIYGQFAKTHRLDSLQNRELLLMWVYRISQCKYPIERSVARPCLEEIKSILVDHWRPDCSDEAFAVLNAFTKEKKSEYVVDVYPCVIGSLLRNPVAKEYPNAYSSLNGCLVGMNRERITREILAGLCKMQSDKVIFRDSLDELARMKFNSSFDELSKENVDTEEIIRSLNLDKWPDSVLPKEAETQDTLGEK